MSAFRRLARAGLVAAAITAGALVAGCAYDYAQRTDRVGFSAGNAVKANLESQTANPSDRARYTTGGLGRDGQVEPVQVQPQQP